MYFPTRRDAGGEGNQDLEPFRNQDGEFQGYFRYADHPKRVVVFFHGNAGEALDRDWVSELFAARDVVILVEYPGYGARRGVPTESALYEAADNVVHEVKRRWPDARMVVMGESLGASVASYVASRYETDRLALITPFKSASDLAVKMYPFLPVRWMLRDKFETHEFLKRFQKPLHIVHGTLDEIVPIASSRELMSFYLGDAGNYTEVPGFNHNNIVGAILDSPFVEDFRQFLKN